RDGAANDERTFAARRRGNGEALLQAFLSILVPLDQPVARVFDPRAARDRRGRSRVAHVAGSAPGGGLPSPDPRVGVFETRRHLDAFAPEARAQVLRAVGRLPSVL